jgi:uncharacterized membrane protein
MWFWLALASAVFGAIDLILNKYCLRKVSAAVLTFSLFVLTLPILALLAFKEGAPDLNKIFFIGALGSSIFFVFSKTMTSGALKQNLISKILPLTAFSGLFTYIFGILFLSETIRLIPVLGLLSIVFGSYILNADQAKEDFLKPFKILFLTKSSVLFLLAVMFGSLTAIFDKLAVTNTVPTSPAFTFFVEQVIMSAILFFYLKNKENNAWFLQLKNNFWILLLNSLVFLIVGFFVLYGYLDGPVALVLGVKRLQIFFVLLLGYLFFKDKPTKHVWLATAIMILGVLMIKLG